MVVYREKELGGKMNQDIKEQVVSEMLTAVEHLRNARNLVEEGDSMSQLSEDVVGQLSSDISSVISHKDMLVEKIKKLENERWCSRHGAWTDRKRCDKGEQFGVDC
jgi:uncharacterized protein YicC (UPF0701 family)